MAIPVVAGRRVAAAPEVAARAIPRVRRFAPSRNYVLIVLALTLVGLLSRVYTTNSLAGEPTPDEFLYGVHARDLARGWNAGEAASLEDLGVEGRSVVVEAAALSLVLPGDPITLGRTLQALFNALCVPMTFVLGRQVGLTRSAALVGAMLLMAVPEFQELAWRFWTDSQATFVCLVYLTALMAFIRRPALLSGLLSVVCLGVLLLTKESAAVTFTPFLVLAVAIPIGRRLTRSGRKYAAIAGGLILVAFVGLGVLLAHARTPGDLAHNALLQKTFGAGPLILSSMRAAIPVIPGYSQDLVGLIGPTDLGIGFLWACLLGLTWLIAQSAVALVTQRPRLSRWVLGWLAAMLVWLPSMVIPWRDLASLHQTEPWIVVAAGALLVVVGTVALYLRNSRRPGWGLAMLGLVVLAVLSERLIISVTPQVSNAALTFRVLLPIVPLFAIVAGGGVWAAAGSMALLMPRVRWARAAFAVAAVAILVTFWSPLLRQRFSSEPLLGRVADRGADPDTPQGLRIQDLVAAQPWLQANLRSSDVILAGLGIPRQLAWYADLDVEGMDNLIDVGSQPERNPSSNPQHALELQRQYILDRVGPRGVDYVVDFNVDWLDPGGDNARQWRQTYDLLRGLPNLEVAYVLNDKFGYPVFYVMRNHGYVNAGNGS
ncbi:MAG: glycosyltransferase family 39 protein [Chloroflexi bacterium]|nr:glycosyltransferase family 39 protein [Chloroflexota bacterium]